MRRRNNQLYMKCVDGQFVLQGQPIGSVIDVQILEVNYWLLKWVDGKVVKRRRVKEGGRWPRGYELSAELVVLYLGEQVSFSVYGQGVTNALQPYLQQVMHNEGVLQDVMTRITCTSTGKWNLLSFERVTAFPN